MIDDPKLEDTLIPEWVRKMGVATWVSDGEGTVVYMNERAGEMLGHDPRTAVGHACSEMIGGRGPDGEIWCQKHCRISTAIAEGEAVEPYTIRIDGKDTDEHWLQMLVIPYETQGGTQRVAHCAFRIDRAHVIESYLDKITSRTPVNVDRSFKLSESRLSKRERDVLELLAEDLNLYEIAEKLSISYYTVRNHVQHVLGKMGVHSTLEAVALYLLSETEDSER